MKVIATEFIKGGFTHKVIDRRGKVLLVERRHADVDAPHWEVVKVRVSPERVVFGVPRPECEVYPSSEAWGKDGWTYTALEEARVKFDSLTTKPT